MLAGVLSTGLSLESDETIRSKPPGVVENNEVLTWKHVDPVTFSCVRGSCKHVMTDFIHAVSPPSAICLPPTSSLVASLLTGERQEG